MMDTTSLCIDVSAWLQGSISAGPPPARLVAHVAGCARCQGALLLVLSEMLGLPGAADDALGCDDCQDVLAAYIDAEREHGAAAAAQAYPRVWWHLWICPLCAETYRLTQELIAAEAAGMLITSAPQPAVRRARLPQLRLERAFLSQVFASQALLGVALGGDEAMILAEEDSGDYRLSLSVQPQDAASYRMSVTVVPPRAGTLLVRIGEQTFRARFSPDGVAEITSIPAALLRATQGADLTLAIEPDDELDTSPPAG